MPWPLPWPLHNPHLDVPRKSSYKSQIRPIYNLLIFPGIYDPFTTYECAVTQMWDPRNTWHLFRATFLPCGRPRFSPRTHPIVSTWSTRSLPAIARPKTQIFFEQHLAGDQLVRNLYDVEVNNKQVMICIYVYNYIYIYYKLCIYIYKAYIHIHLHTYIYMYIYIY